MSGRMGKAVNWLKSGYAWLRKPRWAFVTLLERFRGEPKRPDFRLFTAQEELKANVDVYFKRSVAWQERERARSVAGKKPHRVIQWIVEHRARSVLVLGLATVVLAYCVFTSVVASISVGDGETFIDYFFEALKSPLVFAMLASPVAYVIWLFRDTNARDQIENQRKDTNLKDFQQLCQWASGEHLKADEIEVRSLLAVGNPLQISAAYQLVPYVRGEFGSTFRRPAFKTLMAVWLSLRQHETKRWHQLELTQENRETNDPVGDLHHVISAAITEARGAFIYDHLYDHAGFDRDDHAGFDRVLMIKRAGFDLTRINISGLQAAPLLLAGARWSSVILNEAQLNHAVLHRAELWNCKFNSAKMLNLDLGGAALFECQFNFAKWRDVDSYKGLYLFDCQLQSARLTSCNLLLGRFQKCDFSWPEPETRPSAFGDETISFCNFHFSEFGNCNFEGSTVRWCVFHNAGFSECEFSGTRFTSCSFEGARFASPIDYLTGSTTKAFEGVYFEDCNFSGATINQSVSFDGAFFEDATRWSMGISDSANVNGQPLTRELAIERGAKVVSGGVMALRDMLKPR